MIKIRFLVYGVGDSAYDTAVVIDDVKLTKKRGEIKYETHNYS